MAPESTTTKLEILRKLIKKIAAQHGAKNLRVFGSYATGEATPYSDLDLLVDLEPGHDLLDLIGFKQEVEQQTGIKVDVLTENALSPYIRQHVLAEVQPL